ncbi:MAG: sulfotransferase [Ardenticatenaceae bacterium]|nr:sulfotransferase [Ardenticatenaceae bacterium]
MQKPDFFVVGAPKCGTTSLDHYLNQHPEVFMARPKEPHFFGTDFFRPVYVRNRDEYLSLFSSVGSERRIGETSVWYLYSKKAAVEIRDFCPNAQIIIMLRDPVEMIYSLHSQRTANGNEKILDFEAALQAERDRKQQLATYRGDYPLELLLYREVGMYTEQVKRYVDIFGWQSIHIIIYDDFKSRTMQVYKAVCAFLGVSTDFEPDFVVYNKNKRVRNQYLANFMNNPPGIFQKAVRTLLFDDLRFALRKRIAQANMSYAPRQPMNPALEQELRAFFAPEIYRLSKLVNRDLTYWSKAQARGTG